ncbi:hypothetical protein ACFWF4_20285 [Nocardiopsis flavescens]|uniref:hypothetical protein n=1 Tax=Nocardiopsis flavescens TaxID=758803 RepID=UPI0036689B67
MTAAPVPSPPALGGDRWNTFPGTGTSLTAREFLAAVEPLLQGVIDDNALTAADGPVLETQIRATLALGTREASLPLAVGTDGAPAAREIAGQAERIGGELASWAAASLERLLAERIPLPAGPLAVRSRCHGHLLTPQAVDLLMVTRGGPVTIQLYNEWLHQVVLLRDALLPFANWREVPLAVTPAGLRHTEPARDAFLTELLVRRVRHAAVVDFARAVVTGDAERRGPQGYGFAARGGTALPAVLDLPVREAPRYLLTWRPDTGGGARDTGGGTVTYTARTSDYHAAPRTRVEELPPAARAAHAPLTARVVPDPAQDGVRTASIEVTRAGETVRVDLGQALRGHRFAHRTGDAPEGGPRTRADGVRSRPAPGSAPGDGTAGGASGTASLSDAATGRGAAEAVGDGPTAGAPATADPWRVLRAPGLVWSRAGAVSVDAAGRADLVVLALLGSLYPENVSLGPVGLPDPGTAGGAGRPSPLAVLTDR